MLVLPNVKCTPRYPIMDTKHTLVSEIIFKEVQIMFCCLLQVILY